MTNRELIQNFENLVKEERRITRAILEHIAQIETRKAYLELGFEGMYSYLTKGLGYSEGSAYRRLQAARVYQVEPKIADQLEAGTINLMQLTEVAKLSGLGPAGKNTQTANAGKTISSELFSKLESKSKAETEVILAKEFDIRPKTITKTKLQKDRSVRLELTLSEEQFQELEQARFLLSHICPSGSWVEVITELARQCTKKYRKIESATEKLDAVEEADALNAKKATIHSRPKTPPVRRQSVRPYIPVATSRQIFQRSQGACEHVDPASGRRCGSRYQPQLDHIFAYSKGGGNDRLNLQLLCGQHNRAKGSS